VITAAVPLPAVARGVAKTSPRGRRAARQATMASMSARVPFLLICLSAATCSFADSIDAAKETSAILHVRQLNDAQVQYYAQFGKYASKIAELGPSGAALISAELASGTMNGYRFTLAGDGKTYTIHADAVENAKNRRFFFSDDSTVIRQNRGAPATVHSSEVG